MSETNENDLPNRRISSLLQNISDITGIPVKDIQGDRRTKRVCRARYLIMAAIRHNFPHWARIEAAPYVGRIDHSTIYYGIIRYRELYNKEPSFRAMAEKLGLPEKID